jgi:L-arabinokinase
VLVFYVSSHGFGHASRVIEVINEIGARCPAAHMIVRTAAARWLFDVTLRVPAAVLPLDTDTGVVQQDSLHLDLPGTIAAARAFYGEFGARADREAAFLRACGAHLVIADIPPLAFEAAARAGIPSVAMGNFTWDWIYEAYPDLVREAPDVLPVIRAAHASVGTALRLPMWGGFEGWTCPIDDIPFVARRSTRNPEEVRAHLAAPPGTRLILASFGGLGLASLDLTTLASLRGYTIVTTGHALGFKGPVPPNVRLLGDRDVYQSGLRYEDIVRAADGVVTKPGYGIIAECLANDTALLYTSRGRFAEYDILIDAMPRFLRCGFIGHDDFYGGNWGRYLDQVIAQPAPPERPRTDGAVIAAERILNLACGT